MDIAEFIQKVNDAIINPIIAVLFVSATAVFLWGVVVMIAKSDSETELAKGKQNIFYGIVGMLIMTSVFFIMNIIINTFNLEAPDGESPIEAVEQQE